MRRVDSLLLVLVVLVTACSQETVEPDPTIPPRSGSDTPVNAVEELVGAINEPDFVDASRLAMPGQAALAALAEGASFADVAHALQEGDEQVAANFWSGFAQGTGTFLSGPVTATDDGVINQGDIEFHKVLVQPADGETRTILVREEDGYRVDLFASFGTGLADKMLNPTERLLTAQTEESRTILAEMQGIVPSLMVAASMPGTTGGASQQILALIEVITRVS